MIRASIHGRLGADPVQRETRVGKPMITASVAVDVGRPGDEQAEWVGVVAFGKTGEALAQHRKGDLLSAMGPLTRATYTDRDGKEKTSWSLLIESIVSARTTHEHCSHTGGLTRPSAVAPSRRRTRGIQKLQRSAHAGLPLPEDDVSDVFVEELAP
jgi:single-strand DNA-binding protein